jgi:hypothetical protein
MTLTHHQVAAAVGAEIERDCWRALPGRRTTAALRGTSQSQRRVTRHRSPRKTRVPHPYCHALGQAIYEIALNENYHIGQIAALRKLLGKPRIM